MKETYLELCQKYQATGLTPEEIMDGRLLTGWIPVEEKLPPEPEEDYMDDLEEYIVTIEGAIQSTFLFYAGSGMWYADDTFYNVLAWMPLPEAYK